MPHLDFACTACFPHANSIYRQEWRIGCHHYLTGNDHESFRWLVCIWGIVSSIHVAEANRLDAELGLSMTVSSLPWEL